MASTLKLYSLNMESEEAVSAALTPRTAKIWRRVLSRAAADAESDAETEEEVFGTAQSQEGGRAPRPGPHGTHRKTGRPAPRTLALATPVEDAIAEEENDDDDEDDEDEEDEEEAEAPPLPPRRGTRKRAAPTVEAAPAPPRARAARVPAANKAAPSAKRVVAEEDDDDDKEEEEEEEEEEAPRRSPRCGTNKENAKPPPTAEAAAPKTKAAAARQPAGGAPGEPSARRGHSCTVLGDGRTMVVYGGEATIQAAEAFCFCVDEGWRTLKATAFEARGRAGHGAVLGGDGRVLVFGGSAPGGSAPTRARALDVGALKWSDVDLGARPAARSGGSLVALAGGAVVAIGGDTAAAVLDALGAPYGARKRLPVSGAPPPPFAGGAALPDGAGGAVVLTASGRVYVLEAAGGAWAWDERLCVGPAPPCGAGLACARLDASHLLVHGGADARSGKALAAAGILDTDLWEWAPAPPAVARALGARKRHTLARLDAAAGPAIVCFGGAGPRGAALAKTATLPVRDVLGAPRGAAPLVSDSIVV